jgi:hypothetical protein
MRDTRNAPVMGDGSLTVCAKAIGCSTKDGQRQDGLYLSASSPVHINQPSGSSALAAQGGSASDGDSANAPTVKIHGVAAQYGGNPSGWTADAIG